MTRIPTQTAAKNMQHSMESNFARLTDAQRQLSSGKRLTKISDAPTDAIAANRLRAKESMAGAFISAADDGLSMLAAQDTALQDASSILNRVRELVISGTSRLQSPQARAAIATELETLRDQMVTVANTQFAGRSVFGGFAASAVQNTSGSVAFVGDENTVDRRVSPELTLSVSTNGKQAFGFEAGSPAGTDNVFAVINRAAAAIRSATPEDARAELDNIDARMMDVSGALASVGGRVNQIELVQSQAEDSIVAMRSSRSLLEDVDMGEAVVNLKDAEAAYQATLAVVARLHSTSLLDFLR